MATLIPGIGGCTFDTGGERRFAERLEAKLEDDYLCWYNVPVGLSYGHPDFIVLHPQRGLLILEVKDWKRDTVIQIDKLKATLHIASGIKEVQNPLEQARRYAETWPAYSTRTRNWSSARDARQAGCAFPGAMVWCSPASPASNLTKAGWTP